MKFLRTIEQQAGRLPENLQEYYMTTQLDRITIDGNELGGYYEYSYMDEKSFYDEPQRSVGGIIDNIDSMPTFLTARLIIKYNYMNIEDYRKLMRLLQSKNEFTVTCYNIELDKRVTHNMYFAPPSMPTLYQRFLQPLGITDYTVELIGTNTDYVEHQVTYMYNRPSGKPLRDKDNNIITSKTQEFAENVSEVVGGINTPYWDGTSNVPISKSKVDGLIFDKWTENADGTGFAYVDGSAYFIREDTTLYAQWRASA